MTETIWGFSLKNCDIFHSNLKQKKFKKKLDSKSDIVAFTVTWSSLHPTHNYVRNDDTTQPIVEPNINDLLCY